MTTVAGDSRLLAAAAEASVARFRELMVAGAGKAPAAAAKGALMPHVLVAGKAASERHRPAPVGARRDLRLCRGGVGAELCSSDRPGRRPGHRTQPLSSATVARAKRLRIVSRHGVGYDAVDLPSLNERGIALAVVGDVNSVPVAEHAMMLLLRRPSGRARRSVSAGGQLGLAQSDRGGRACWQEPAHPRLWSHWSSSRRVGGGLRHEGPRP